MGKPSAFSRQLSAQFDYSDGWGKASRWTLLAARLNLSETSGKKAPLSLVGDERERLAISLAATVH